MSSSAVVPEASASTRDIEAESQQALLHEQDNSSASKTKRVRVGLASAVLAVTLLVCAAALHSRVAAGDSRAVAKALARARVLEDDPSFDCHAGVMNWQRGWSGLKKQWCCQYKSVACQDGNLDSSHGNTPFNCTAGLSNWDAGWAFPKKVWCCANEGKGCDVHNLLKVTWVLANVDYFELKSSPTLEREMETSVKHTLESMLLDFGVRKDNITLKHWAGSALHSTGPDADTGVVVRATIAMQRPGDYTGMKEILESDLFKVHIRDGVMNVIASVASGTPSVHDVMVEPQITGCTCKNGVPAEQGACSSSGDEVCQSCNHGYYLTSSHTCLKNECICHGGIPASGNACPGHQNVRCSSCFPGRHFNVEDQACRLNECHCEMGFPATDEACSQDHAAICGSCYPGYFVDQNTKECVPKRCVCENGIAVSPKKCEEHGQDQCEECHPGFHVDSSSQRCVVNTCTCISGQEAVGVNCIAHDTDICVSCDTGLLLHNGHCTGDKVCNCPNGTAATGAACTTNYATICTRCNLGFQLYQDQCVNDRCVCENGVAATGSVCKQQGGNQCASCNDGYWMRNGKCVASECECDNGVGAKGTQCAKHGAHSCAECDAGYHSDLFTVDEVDDNGKKVTILAIRCVKNTCHCETSVGKVAGIPASGESQSDCFADGANVCSKCFDNYQMDSSHNCVPNKCDCPDGTPVEVEDCHEHGAVQCSSCNSGYWLAKDSNWEMNDEYTGGFDKASAELHWKAGGAICLPDVMTTNIPFDCDAALSNWELAWSPTKKAWCCQNHKKGCIPTDTASDACENKGFNQMQCDAVGCCQFLDGTCSAKQGLEDEVCKPHFSIIADATGTCMKAVADPNNPKNKIVVLDKCESDDEGQAWRPNNKGQIHNGAGLCLEVETLTNHTPLSAGPCAQDTSSSHFLRQHLKYDLTSKALKVHSGHSDGLCLMMVNCKQELPALCNDGETCASCVEASSCLGGDDDLPQRWAVSVVS